MVYGRVLTTMGAPEDDTTVSHGKMHETEADRIAPSKKATDKNVTVEVDENGQAEDAPKKQYSKLSIWLNIIYAGLAIGSDG